MYRPLAVLSLALLTGPLAAQPFTLADGDRVVLLGNTLIEREQRAGYWETALTSRFPGRNVTFRNLGWSGDTVFGEARAGFGSVADGFRHLKEHTLALKPTVIILGYGANESFGGPEALPGFVKGFETLLDTLAPAKARLILLAPLRQENLGRPLPDPAAVNRNLRLYADAVRDLARKRDHAFVDLYDLLPDGAAPDAPAPLTDNGVHLSAWGYWRAAAALQAGLGQAPRAPAWRVELALAKPGAAPKATGAKVEAVPGEGVRFSVTDEALPPPPAPAEGAPRAAQAAAARVLVIPGLPAGRHALVVDGAELTTATAAEWAAGVNLARGPEFTQAEALRQAVVKKNELYFHRWRPQNETYLFGFRKHEQGRNAREIPQFDPLVEAKEAEIHKLAVPVTHSYEIRPAR